MCARVSEAKVSEAKICTLVFALGLAKAAQKQPEVGSNFRFAVTFGVAKVLLSLRLSNPLGHPELRSGHFRTQNLRFVSESAAQPKAEQPLSGVRPLLAQPSAEQEEGLTKVGLAPEGCKP